MKINIQSWVEHPPDIGKNVKSLIKCGKQKDKCFYPESSLWAVGNIALALVRDNVQIPLTVPSDVATRTIVVHTLQMYKNRNDHRKDEADYRGCVEDYLERNVQLIDGVSQSNEKNSVEDFSLGYVFWGIMLNSTYLKDTYPRIASTLLRNNKELREYRKDVHDVQDLQDNDDPGFLTAVLEKIHDCLRILHSRYSID